VFETPQGGPFNVDPYLPTFWAPRAPNEVLTDGDYQIVMDSTKPLADRIAAFNRRPEWTRNLFTMSTPWIDQLTNMVNFFGSMGVVEKRPGITSDPNFPNEMYVESLPDLIPLPPPIPPGALAAEPVAPLTMSRAVMRLRFGSRRP
jgi:hypothetical protein